MLSANTRRARSRLANAVRRGEDIDAAQTAYDVERALDLLRTIRGATTPDQRQRLYDAVEATGGEQP